MSPPKAPHQGYNHNVRHLGHVFHVQTEDSGGKNPHIETHVYYEGVILASKRTPYADYMSDPNPDSTIRRLMQEQHKELLKELRGGAMDDRISEALAKHKKKAPRDETVPFGMKPLPGEKLSTGDLPVAAPPEARPRRPATPVPVARPPIARPIRRGDQSPRQAAVVVSRPVHVVAAGTGTRPVSRAGRVTGSTDPAGSVATPAPAAAHPSTERSLDLDAVILRYLMEDLERGE